MQLRLRPNGHLYFALLGLIAVSVGILISSEIGHEKLRTSYSDVIQEAETSSELSVMLGYVAQAESSQRGYLMTERKKYLDAYNYSRPSIAPLFSKLKIVYETSGDARLKADFSAVTAALEERLSLLDTTFGLLTSGKRDLAMDLFKTDIGEEKMELLRTSVQRMLANERQRSNRAVEDLKYNHEMSRMAVAIVTGLNILLTIFIFRWLRADWERERLRQQELTEQSEKLDQLVTKRTSQLEILASHLQQVSENEKTKLARELHDELGAILTASMMDVSWVRQHLVSDQSALAAKLTRTLGHLQQGVQAKRRLIENLMPSTLTSFGLVVALRELAENMQASAGWALHLTLPEKDLELAQEPSIAMYRIAQEAITNIAKYAAAKTVSVTLNCDGQALVLEIADDGVGFDARHMRPQSHGLPGMRQRMVGLGGTLQVESSVGKGTRVQAHLPIAAQPLAI
jgi:signal transduction histidine kinase